MLEGWSLNVFISSLLVKRKKTAFKTSEPWSKVNFTKQNIKELHEWMICFYFYSTFFSHNSTLHFA